MAWPRQPYHYLELGTDMIPVYDVKGFSADKIKNRNLYLDTENQKCAVQWMKTKMIHYGKSDILAQIGFSYSFDYDDEMIIVDRVEDLIERAFQEEVIQMQ